MEKCLTAIMLYVYVYLEIIKKHIVCCLDRQVKRLPHWSDDRGYCECVYKPLLVENE